MGVSGPADQISTSPPVVANGRLIVGERIVDNVNRNIPSGVVRAYDPITGAGIWAWDVGRSQDAIPPLPAGETYTRGHAQCLGRDDRRSGQWPGLSGHRQRLARLLDRLAAAVRRPVRHAIVALEIATGKLRWVRQLVHRDMWDMDIPIGPSLFDYRAPNGQTIRR